MFGDMDTAFGSVVASLRTHMPLGFIVEEVKGFAMSKKGDTHTELQKFVDAIQTIRTDPNDQQSPPAWPYYKVFLLDPSCWLDIGRPRVYCIFIGRKLT